MYQCSLPVFGDRMAVVQENIHLIGIMHYNMQKRDITSTTFSQCIRKQKLFVLYLQHFWVCFSKKVNKGRNISNCSPNSMQAGSYHVSKETRAILSGGKWKASLPGDTKHNKEQFWSTRLKRESIKRLHTECGCQFPSPVLPAEHQQQEYIRSFSPRRGIYFQSVNIQNVGTLEWKYWGYSHSQFPNLHTKLSVNHQASPSQRAPFSFITPYS